MPIPVRFEMWSNGGVVATARPIEWPKPTVGESVTFPSGTMVVVEEVNHILGDHCIRVVFAQVPADLFDEVLRVSPDWITWTVTGGGGT